MPAVADRTLETAIEYAGHGWLLVPIYGETAGVCECRNGAKCDTPGKHPRLKSWQEKASCDEDVIAEWFEKWPNSNIGVLLGPKSGIVDVEYDSEEGRKTAEKILGDAVTASFKSTRGRHCLFRWQEWMPDMDARSGEIDYMGLELRLGHRTRGFQAVLPPSSGRVSLPGHAVDDVGIADPPDGIEAIVSIGETKVEARK